MLCKEHIFNWLLLKLNEQFNFLFNNGNENFFFRMKMNGQFVPSVKHIVLQGHITVGMLKVISFLPLWHSCTELKKKRLDQVTYCWHMPKFEARLFWSLPSWWDNRRRQSFGFAVWRWWILNIQTVYSSKSLLLSEPSMFYRFLITEISYQSGLTKMAAVNFLAFLAAITRLRPFSRALYGGMPFLIVSRWVSYNIKTLNFMGSFYYLRELLWLSIP